MKRVCNECERPLSGRSDKKFCSDVCRTSYHNTRNASNQRFMREINLILIKNRRILNALIKQSQKKVDKSVMVSMGFDFQFHTHLKKQQEGGVMVFCYDVGYCKEKEGLYHLHAQTV